jgi:hypothetical protein
MSNKTWIYISLAALGVALYLYYKSSVSGTPKTVDNAIALLASQGIGVTNLVTDPADGIISTVIGSPIAG